MHETLRRSSLGALAPGARANLELALRVGDRLGRPPRPGPRRWHRHGGGDQLGRLRSLLEVDLDPELARYLVEKGSVALDGVSLTVSALRDDGFAVSLIPETISRPISPRRGGSASEHRGGHARQVRGSG